MISLFYTIYVCICIQLLNRDIFITNHGIAVTTNKCLDVDY